MVSGRTTELKPDHLAPRRHVDSVGIVCVDSPFNKGVLADHVSRPCYKPGPTVVRVAGSRYESYRWCKAYLLREHRPAAIRMEGNVRQSICCEAERIVKVWDRSRVEIQERSQIGSAGREFGRTPAREGKAWILGMDELLLYRCWTKATTPKGDAKTKKVWSGFWSCVASIQRICIAWDSPMRRLHLRHSQSRAR